MTAPVDKLSREELLDRFQAKARCEYTKYEAQSIWLRLRGHLSDVESSKLAVAWNHAQEVPANRDAQELDRVCAEIRSGWAVPE